MRLSWRTVALLATGVAVLPLGALPTHAASAPSFSSPVQVGTGGSEPGIAAAPDGTLYINAPDGLLANGTSPSYVWRSSDGGASWTPTPAGMRGLLPGGGDAQVAVDPVTGDLAMIDLWLGSSTASVSTDRAGTWTAQPLGGPPLQDRPWIASAGNGTVYLATHQVPTSITVSKSTDGGLVYPLTSPAATVLDQTGCVCPPGNVIAQGGGGLLGTSDRVGVVYATSSGGVAFAYSTNGGLTFTNATVGPASSATTNANFPVVANGGGNHLYAVWLAETGSASNVLFSQSANWGATWSAPVTIVSGGTSVYPWVSASGSTVAVSLYHSTTAAATPDTVPGGTGWYESALESQDGGASWSALTTADPTPAKTGPVCTGGVNCAGNRELGDFQTDLLDPSGRLDLTYVRVSAAGVQVVEFVRGG